MKKIILLIVAFALLAQACIRDLGNYDYRDINELEFLGLEGLGTTGMSSSMPYNVENRFEGITLIPKLATSMETEANLVFTWLHDSAGVRVPFHHGRNLENVVVPPRWDGLVVATFRITDTISQKILNTSIFINVVNPFRSGYLVLQEDAQGYMRLDMLSWLPGEGYRHLQNVLEGRGFPRQRGAKLVRLFPDAIRAAAFGGTSIFIVTDEPDVYRIHSNSFEWAGEQGHIRNQFLNPAMFPADARVDNILAHNGNSAILLNMEGNLFFQLHTASRFFGVELNTTQEGLHFPASRHISRSGRNHFLIFDEESQSFYSLLPVNNVRSTRITTSDTIVSFRNMGMDLVFSQAARATVGVPGLYLSYNILKDANGVFWVLRVNMDDLSQQFWRRLDVPAGFNENSVMVVGGVFANRQMYVAIGGNVYQYNIELNRFAPVLTLPPGEVVTYMEFLPNPRHYGPGDENADPPVGFDAHRFIVVGSFNEGTGVGTLTHYRIPDGTGHWEIYQDSRTGQLHRWTGFGRIKDMANR